MGIVWVVGERADRAGVTRGLWAEGHAPHGFDDAAQLVAALRGRAAGRRSALPSRVLVLDRPGAGSLETLQAACADVGLRVEVVSPGAFAVPACGPGLGRMRLPAALRQRVEVLTLTAEELDARIAAELDEHPTVD